MKRYLRSELKHASDADPVVLTDYIIALLKHDQDLSDLQQELIQQLKDFIDSDSEAFVIRLFDKIKYMERKVEPESRRDRRDYDRRDYEKRDYEMDHDRRDYERRDYDRRDHDQDRRGYRKEWREKTFDRNEASDRRDRRDNDRRGPRSFQHQGGKFIPDDDSVMLVVRNIPFEFFSKDSVKAHFESFGNVQVFLANDEDASALVKFDTHEDASFAIHSPQVLFNNRFVKVYWCRPQDESQFDIKEEDPEEVAREAEAKRLELEQKRKAFFDMQKEKAAQIQSGRTMLVEKQLEEQRKILARLEDKSISLEEKKQLMEHMKLLHQSTQSIMASTSKPIAIGKQTEVTEVQSNIAATPEAEGVATFAYRGRGRGRGRGVGRYNLDLRPTKFVVSEIGADTEKYYMVIFFETGNSRICIV